MKLIDLDNAVNRISLLAESVNPHYRECILSIALYLKNENDFPVIADNSAKVGRWIEYDNSHCECSLCLSVWSYFENMTEFFNYCPSCGARMEVTE